MRESEREKERERERERDTDTRTEPCRTPRVGGSHPITRRGDEELVANRRIIDRSMLWAIAPAPSWWSGPLHPGW